MTTRRDKDARPAPDLVDRDFTASGPSQLWVVDTTHVPALAGFLYLAAVLDAWSRRVVGYAISRLMDASITVAVLKVAIRNRAPLEGCTHRPDRGVQPGFNRSSQHRMGRRLRWRVGGVRIGLCVAS